MWPDRVMGVWPTEGFTPALGASREHRPESPRDACPSNSHQQSTSWRLLEAARGAPAPPGRKVGSRCVKVSAGESGGRQEEGVGCTWCQKRPAWEGRGRKWKSQQIRVRVGLSGRTPQEPKVATQYPQSWQVPT